MEISDEIVRNVVNLIDDVIEELSGELNIRSLMTYTKAKLITAKKTLLENSCFESTILNWLVDNKWNIDTNDVEDSTIIITKGLCEIYIHYDIMSYTIYSNEIEINKLGLRGYPFGDREFAKDYCITKTLLQKMEETIEEIKPLETFLIAIGFTKNEQN